VWRAGICRTSGIAESYRVQKVYARIAGFFLCLIIDTDTENLEEDLVEEGSEWIRFAPFLAGLSWLCNGNISQKV
jgi:hypothetical protein